MMLRSYHLALPAEDADVLEAAAAALQRPAATIASRVLSDALRRGQPTDDGAAETLAAARERIEELEAALSRLEGSERPAGAGPAGEGPAGPARWEWPIGDLLADGQWWDRWLPRLHELMGRSLRAPSEGPVARDLSRARAAGVPVVDARGYSDLPSYLFPPVERAGAEPVTWRSPDYPGAASAVPPGSDGRGGEAGAPGERAQVWEPIVRHVAKALALLEDTSKSSGDAYLRLRGEEEITGSWLNTLRYLLGEAPPGLERIRRPS